MRESILENLNISIREIATNPDTGKKIGIFRYPIDEVSKLLLLTGIPLYTHQTPINDWDADSECSNTFIAEFWESLKFKLSIIDNKLYVTGKISAEDTSKKIVDRQYPIMVLKSKTGDHCDLPSRKAIIKGEVADYSPQVYK